jgi:ADP-ribose pyrophosphatase YjhB (NUDIX family)
VSIKREYPHQPVVGVGGVVIRDDQALLIRRAAEPLKGQWSIPGGTLELGETLIEGVRRELREETGLDVLVLDLLEVFERIMHDPQPPDDAPGPRYHFVIADYLCEAPEGDPVAGSDVTDLAFVREEDLPRYGLTPTATRVVRKAFAMARAAQAAQSS